MILLNNPNAVWLKRTVQGRYFFNQSTPKSGFLDPAWDRSVPIWPGMVMMRTAGVAYGEIPVSNAPGDIVLPPTQLQTGYPAGAEASYTLINGSGHPQGLVGQYIGGDNIDELIVSGINALSVWVMGPDAEFNIQAPAFDASLNWAAADPGDGTDVFVYARTDNLPGVTGLAGMGGPLGTTGLRGQIVLASDAKKSTEPVGVLLGVQSPTSIIIGGLPVRYAIGAVGGVGGI